MNVIIELVRPGATMPERAHGTDVGFDVKACACEYDIKTDTYIYYTGVKMETHSKFNTEVNSCYGFPRSSNSKKEAYLTNSVGIIDSDGFRGEVQARYKNRTSLKTMIDIETNKRMLNSLYIQLKTGIGGKLFGTFEQEYNELYKLVEAEYIDRARALEFAPYEVGDKVVQLVFATETVPTLIQGTVNTATERGEGGFGTTGK